MRHLSDAVFDDDVIIVVLIVVDAVFDEVAEDVALAFGGSPLIADVGRDVDDLEGSEETIVNAFFQAVGVDGFTEIVDIRLVSCFFRCGGHAELDGAIEILQDLAPVAVVLGAATVALVNNDEVEESGLEEFLVVLAALLTNQLLVQGEIDLVSGNATLDVLLVVHLVDGLFKRLEILLYGLVDQDVAVSQIEYLLHHACLKQTVDDLEGSIGLSRSCGHDQQQAVSALCHGIHGAVDGIALVIARRKDVLTRAIGLLDDLHLFLGHALPVVDFSKISVVKF